MSEKETVEIGPGEAQLRLAIALAEADTPAAVADAVARWAASAAGSAFANLAVFHPGRNALRVVHPDLLDPVIAHRWTEISLDTPTPLCEAVLCTEPVLLPNFEAYADKYAVLVEDTAAAGLQATASLPLVSASGAGIGAVGFAWTEPQAFGAAQLSRLRLVAGLAAQALERASSPAATPISLGRAAARALQEAFLPSVATYSGDLDIAAAYLPSSGSAMGGDWFDVFPVPSGTCLVVGDIGGHGLEAAALMAEVRSAIRAFAVDDPSPARIVARANNMLCRLHPNATATAIVCVWDAVSKAWLRANAGHPPILVCQEAKAEYIVAPERDPLLGANPDSSYRELTGAFEVGATLLMYTDGLVELRSSELTYGMETLRQHAQSLADLAPQTLVDDLLLWRLGQGPLDDDLCLMALRLV